MTNPLKAICDIRRNEIPFVTLMFSYFFLVISTFWILKPLKKALFLRFHDEAGFDLFSLHFTGSQAELLAKVMNMVVAILAVAVFTYLVRHFRRHHLTFIFSSFFLAGYVAYTFVVESINSFAVWSFYLFGYLYSTLSGSVKLSCAFSPGSPNSRLNFRPPLTLLRPSPGWRPFWRSSSA